MEDEGSVFQEWKADYSTRHVHKFLGEDALIGNVKEWIVDSGERKVRARAPAPTPARPLAMQGSCSRIRKVIVMK